MAIKTTALPQPTRAQIRQYAEQLPDGYRQLLKFMIESDPEREHSDIFSLSVLMSRLSMYDFRVPDFLKGLHELEEHHFLTVDHRLGSVEMTDSGEQLLNIVTGTKPKEFRIPKLPKPHWIAFR